MQDIQRLVTGSLLIASASTQGQAQTSARSDSMTLRQDLSEFEGDYRYRDGSKLVMVAGSKGLVAVIGEAKYPLRAVSPDTFTNPGGDRIPFVRNAAGRIVAFEEHGDTFARVSTEVSPEIQQLLVPRTPGPDGRPLPYRWPGSAGVDRRFARQSDDV